jgi:F-type H+-transporting ATPase subunit gamma
MATLRDLRRRIKSVQGTQQITKAMQMVAAARLRRAQDKVESSRPYASKMQSMLDNLTRASASLDHPLFEKRQTKRIGIVVVTSDRGLCGSYNHNVIAEAERLIKSCQPEQVSLIPVGKKGHSYYSKRACRIVLRYLGLGGLLDWGQVRSITNDLVNLFLSREVDEIHLVYTKFLSAVSHKATTEKFLNIESQEKTEIKQGQVDYIFEPGPEKIFSTLLPSYCLTRVQTALAEAFASEHAARMISMSAATKNAEEMIEDLTLVMNKLRQATITKEMLEITTGAEALKG